MKVYGRRPKKCAKLGQEAPPVVVVNNYRLDSLGRIVTRRFEESFFERQLQIIQDDMVRRYNADDYWRAAYQLTRPEPSYRMYYVDFDAIERATLIMTYLEKFVQMTKQIVLTWADSIPDLTKRTLMLEPYPVPLVR